MSIHLEMIIVKLNVLCASAKNLPNAKLCIFEKVLNECLSDAETLRDRATITYNESTEAKCDPPSSN